MGKSGNTRGKKDHFPVKKGKQTPQLCSYCEMSKNQSMPAILRRQYRQITSQKKPFHRRTPLCKQHFSKRWVKPISHEIGFFYCPHPHQLDQVTISQAFHSFQRPRVKSGILTGWLPFATERSESSQMEESVAASYTFISVGKPFWRH